MIAFSKDMPFGGRAAFVQTPMFHCGVSTAKDGLFKPRITMIVADAVVAGDGIIRGRPAVKFIYSKSLRDADYLTMHDTIVRALDAMGTEGASLFQSVTFIAAELKKTGMVNECLNLLTEEESSSADYAQQVRQHIEETISGVGLALYGYLAPSYKRQHGADIGGRLAAAVTNLLMLRAPSDNEARTFDAKNVALVDSLVVDLANVPQIRTPMSILIHTAMDAAKGAPTATVQHITTAVRLASTGFLVPMENLKMPTQANEMRAAVEGLVAWLKNQPQ